MKEILKKIILQIFKVVLFSDKINLKLLMILSKVGIKNYYYTYHLRPKNIDMIINDRIKIKSDKKLGIVIQGPIVYEDNFTLNTIKLYKKNFENSIIVLSIWESEDEEKLKEFYSENIIILKNKKPKNNGFINLNYQIVSTRSAVQKAFELECDYIMKTRTDFRIYETGVKEFLIELLNQYPCKTKKQRSRIIGVDINTHRYGIGISDVFQFSEAEEMLKMWDVELTKNNMTLKEYKELIELNSTATDRYYYEFSECYLLKNYSNKINVNLEPTLKSYYKILKENFIIIDAQMINLFWNKYLGDEYKGWNNYNKKIANSSLKFKDWLTIYSNDDIKFSEELLEKNYEFWKKNTIENL